MFKYLIKIVLQNSNLSSNLHGENLSKSNAFYFQSSQFYIQIQFNSLQQSEMWKIYILLILIETKLISVVKFGRRVRIVPDEHFQYCTDQKSSGEILLRGNITEFAVEYLVDDDEVITFSGNITFLIPISVKPATSVIISGEKYRQNGWHLMAIKNLQDTCFDFFNPTDIFYPYTKDLKRCPYEAGVSSK